jgi:hypothetical protein
VKLALWLDRYVCVCVLHSSRLPVLTGSKVTLDYVPNVKVSRDTFQLGLAFISPLFVIVDCEQYFIQNVCAMIISMPNFTCLAAADHLLSLSKQKLNIDFMKLPSCCFTVYKLTKFCTF